MVEGLWIVQYEGVQGNGGGVVVLMDGHLLGGDSGWVYTGTYKTNDATIDAHVIVRNFLPDVPSVLGVPGDFDLNLRGTVAGGIIRGSASLVQQPGAGIVVKLTKVQNLPQ